MISNEMIAAVIAIAVGYLLGSIPSAYLVARLITGKDIRQMGGGNVGGLNTFREVGGWPALAVGVFDVGKGVAAVVVAYWGLGLVDLTRPWVLASGMAAVIGHNWMVWLRFSGGKGMGWIGVLFGGGTRAARSPSARRQKLFGGVPPRRSALFSHRPSHGRLLRATSTAINYLSR